MTAPCSTRGPEGSIPKTKTAPSAEADEAAVGSHVSPPCGGDGVTLIAPTPPRPAPCEVRRTVPPKVVSQRRAATISVFEHNQHPKASTEQPTLRCSHDGPVTKRPGQSPCPGPRSHGCRVLLNEKRLSADAVVPRRLWLLARAGALPGAPAPSMDQFRAGA